MRLDLQNLGFDRGGALLVKRALEGAAGGRSSLGRLRNGTRTCLFIFGDGAALRGIIIGVRVRSPERASSTRGPPLAQQWHGAERAGRADPFDPAAVVEHPPQRWGFAARGALIESGSP